MSDKETSKKENWEKDLIENLALDSLKERRRARRWGIFFKILTFGYIGTFIYLAMPDNFDFGPSDTNKSHVAIVKLNGLIAPAQGVAADTVIKGLNKAFKNKGTKAVILKINSPGGSPVQSSYIQKEINRLKNKYKNIPIYTVVGDVCASGGYYVASATDKIFVNESSIIGSIGVLMNGFGFSEALTNLGIERRLLISGEHKDILDPFSPMSDFDKNYAKKLLTNLHENFIEAVKEGRGDRLSNTDIIFSGLFWPGKEAIDLGLADQIGNVGYVTREVIGIEKIIDFTETEDPLERLVNRLGASIAQTFAQLTGLSLSPRM